MCSRKSPNTKGKNNFRIALIFLAALSLVTPGFALSQEKYVGPTRYLDELKEAERLLATTDPIAQKGQYGVYLQTLGVAQSRVGDVDGAINSFDKFQSTWNVPQEPAVDIDGLTAEDAIAAIINAARKRQIVILNEGHNMPMHRAFAQKLSRELRKLGFSYLACETFGESIADVARIGVTWYSGYYTQDPVFGEFVREAHKSGWTLVPYETITDDVSELSHAERMKIRELGQAQNLVDRILTKDPTAKIFIFVGYGHARKAPKAKQEGLADMMAEYLRRLSGIDPLVIDQTKMYSHPEQAFELPPYRPIVQVLPRSEPFVLRKADGGYRTIGYAEGMVDFVVVHPPYPMENGRPQWLRTLAGRVAREIPAGLLPESGRRVISVFREEDSGDAVPVDVVLLEAGKPMPMLMLPEGKFRLTVEN